MIYWNIPFWLSNLGQRSTIYFYDVRERKAFFLGSHLLKFVSHSRSYQLSTGRWEKLVPNVGSDLGFDLAGQKEFAKRYRPLDGPTIDSRSVVPPW